MTPPMVERVARAIDPLCFEPEVERVYGDLWALHSQHKAREKALAALRAMREPTLTMLGDGETAIMYCEDTTQDSYGSYTWIDHRRAAVETWAAMIDAAINEGK